MKKFLSILIPTLEERKHYLERLLSVINAQNTDGVEIIIEKDNKEKSIGEKRNILLEKSSAKYIAFIDDDDLISFDYISKVKNACIGDPDVIGMHLLHYENSLLRGLTYHSLRYSKWWEERDTTSGLMRYYRNPNHLNPVKRDLALKVKFPSISMGEDKEYSKQLLPLLKTETYVYEPIYYYLFQPNK